MSGSYPIYPAQIHRTLPRRSLGFSFAPCLRLCCGSGVFEPIGQATQRLRDGGAASRGGRREEEEVRRAEGSGMRICVRREGKG
jgi:hypothetical protein